MNSNYTMEDIEKFINDYNESQMLIPDDMMLNIPIFGRRMYQKAVLEDQKRTIFEEAYNKAMAGSPEEQRKFISDMAPVLDEFYSKNKKSKR
ncbi:MAG: hypothetical protein IK137_04235 [Bacilli bacterium]|nr:hypothetical protein [Bacilli bacterium]